jgi:hypothetical protein
MRAGHFKKREKREMNEIDVWHIVEIVPEYIASISPLLNGIGPIIEAKIRAIISDPKVKYGSMILKYVSMILKDVIMIKDEILYGENAKNRYESIKDMLPTAYPYIWGPVLWEGNQNTPHIFEVKRFAYDENTMGAEWKGCKKSVRYIFKDGTGKTMVKGWRLRK